MNERVFQETFMRPFMCLSAFSLLVGNLDKKKKYHGLKNCVKSSLDDRL